MQKDGVFLLHEACDLCCEALDEWEQADGRRRLESSEDLFTQLRNVISPCCPGFLTGWCPQDGQASHTAGQASSMSVPVDKKETALLFCCGCQPTRFKKRRGPHQSM